MCPLPIDQGERVALGGIVRPLKIQVKGVARGADIE